jgi:hypothetical protein
MADEHVMSNYFPVAVGHAGHQWLVSLPPNYFDSWQELKQAFIDNFIATCEQPGNKYDLQRIRDRKDEPLREYVRRFSEMRSSERDLNQSQHFWPPLRNMRTLTTLKR